MRKISVKEANKAALSGAKVNRSKPSANTVDRGPEINLLTAKVKVLSLAVDQLKESLGGSSGNQGKIIDHLSVELNSLKNQIEKMQEPKQVSFQRGPNGYMASLSVGGRTYKFDRNRAGFIESATELSMSGRKG